MRMLSVVGVLPAKPRKVGQKLNPAERHRDALVQTAVPSRLKLGQVVVVLLTMRMLSVVGAQPVKPRKVGLKLNPAAHQVVARVRVGDLSRPKLGQVVVVL